MNSNPASAPHTGSLARRPDGPPGDHTSGVHLLVRLAEAIERCEVELRRIADHFNQPPSPIVGTKYVSDRLDITPERVTQLTREGAIPPSCLVEGTGNGKPWKYHRRQIDAWIKSR